MSEYDFPFGKLPFFGKNAEINARLGRAARQLSVKLKKIAPKLKALGISPYSQRYMDVVFGKPFRRNYNLTKYAHILSNALEDRSIADLPSLTLVDYGGGHGTLSLLAKQAGVGNVIHSEIFATSSQDAQIIAKAIGARPGPFYLGDTDDFRRQMEALGQSADIIVNYDVLEHVYGMRRYLLDMAAVTKPGGRWFMGSGANLYDEEARRNFVKLHDDTEGTLDNGNPASYVNVRAQYIRDRDPGLLPEEVTRLAKATRGWRKDDIERAVDIYISSGHIVEYCPDQNNTSDPRNGNWAENTLPIETFTESPVLKAVAKSIAVRPSPQWTPFIEGEAAEIKRWIALSQGDPAEALKESPYYSLDVRF